ncbi:hypothetical protein [Streptomyces lydicus]|uniref:hypothetical protein n=1 Tax=Streptomyces lydicus TaxID=47763 RepID=UPI0010135B7B|nr:hypothetical protein [Streptomyces lydicus]MCZ1012048.1 hypothetical protein [Streptomyces lydicus]
MFHAHKALHVVHEAFTTSGTINHPYPPLMASTSSLAARDHQGNGRMPALEMVAGHDQECLHAFVRAAAPTEA